MDEQQVASISATSVDESAGEDGLRNLQDIEPFLDSLIERQCQLLGAVAGLIIMQPMRGQSKGLTARHQVDDKHPLAPQQYKRLSEVGLRAVKSDGPISDTLAAAQGLLSAEPAYRVLASPLRIMGRPHGASICVVQDTPGLDVDDGLARLELSCVLMESYLWRQQAYAEAQSKIQLRESLDLLDKAQQGHNVQETATLFAHELQRRFGCSRVSIGLVHFHAIRLAALSGTEDVDRKSELAEALEAVMEECADQDIEIRCPQPEDIDPSERRVVRAHASLSERFGPCAIASFPLRLDGGLIGVVVLEREAQDPFNDATLRLLRLIAEYLGPTVWTRRMADRGVLAVTRDRSIEMAQLMVGPKKTGAKLFALLVLILVLAVTLIPVPDQIIATGRIIADQRRQVSAPFTGSIEEVIVQPGDVVKAGDELLRLDTKKQQFQLVQKENERKKLITEADTKRAKGELSAARMLEAQIRGITGEIDLLQYEINKAIIRSPIDGVITQGRLEDMIGEIVKPDTPLLEISQPETLRAIALVPESSITRVHSGQAGRLALTARPTDRIGLTVGSITPASEVVGQRNVYRVDIELEEPPEWMRPGMEGQVKIRGQRTNLFMVYARPMLNAIRMRLWW